MTVTVVMRDGSQDHLSDDAVHELRTKLRGQLVVSDESEAGTEPREVWNVMHVDRPAITARCAGTADVVDAVNFARERGLLVAARGGGHSVTGLKALDRPAPLTAVNTLHVGGAVHAVAAEDTAFAERSAPFMVTIDTNWADPAQDTSAVAWGRSAWEEITKYGNGNGNVFLNFTGRADEPVAAHVPNAFGNNLRRLGIRTRRGLASGERWCLIAHSRQAALLWSSGTSGH